MSGVSWRKDFGRHGACENEGLAACSGLCTADVVYTRSYMHYPPRTNYHRHHQYLYMPGHNTVVHRHVHDGCPQRYVRRRVREGVRPAEPQERHASSRCVHPSSVHRGGGEHRHGTLDIHPPLVTTVTTVGATSPASCRGDSRRWVASRDVYGQVVISVCRNGSGVCPQRVCRTCVVTVSGDLPPICMSRFAGVARVGCSGPCALN